MPERKEADFLHEVAFNKPHLRSNSADATTHVRAEKSESIDPLCRNAGKRVLRVEWLTNGKTGNRVSGLNG
jgi:hypothetical protein